MSTRLWAQHFFIVLGLYVLTVTALLQDPTILGWHAIIFLSLASFIYLHERYYLIWPPTPADVPLLSNQEV